MLLKNCDSALTDKMSSTDNLEAKVTDVKCCASCGIAEVDDIELKNCDVCDLVRYCSEQCQQDHRPNHEAMCKERAAELRDELLFRQPEGSYLGDCPICCLPLSVDSNKYVKYFCCSKEICNGCTYANMNRQVVERSALECPFCRQPYAKSKEEDHRLKKKRCEANDPFALREEGRTNLIDGDYERAFEYLAKAAELGDMEAHYGLSLLYREGGEGVEKDKSKETYHFEEAAIGGHPDARHMLGCNECENGRLNRAVKHWIVAAKLGDDESIERLKEGFKFGYVRKEDFASALRGHQAAVDATKSQQREEAEKLANRAWGGGSLSN